MQCNVLVFPEEFLEGEERSETGTITTAALHFTPMLRLNALGLRLMLRLCSFDLQRTSSGGSGSSDISSMCGGGGGREEFKGHYSVKHQLGDPCAYHRALALALLVAVALTFITAMGLLRLLCSNAY